MSVRKMLALAIAGVFVLIGALSASQIVEGLSASEYMVIQSVVAGDLKVYTEPGTYYQGFGHVTKYPRRVQYSFNKGCKGGDPEGFPPKNIRFNDGGHASLCGSISWEMPVDAKAIIRLHKEFGSALAIESSLISKAIDNAAFTAGPMMSSTESSGARRTELIQAVSDQTLNGTFETKTTTEKQIDPLTKAETLATVAVIVKDDKGNPKRLSQGAVSGYNIILLPMNINDLAYEDSVEKQIAERQRALTQVQIAQANARRAEQDAATAEQQGRANAATAKWKQETLNAEQQAIAEQKLRSQDLATKSASLFKQEQTLIGEGEAARKSAVMAADGALDPKLEAYKEVNAKYADAIAKYTGAWVPSVVMGNGGTNAGGGATSLIDMLTAKTAKDLGLDMSLQGKGATAKGK